MSKLEIFDPAMCCSTGVCGPSVDPELLRVSTIVNILNKKGFNVIRHNLSQEPQAFVQNQKVSELLKSKGSEVLPITLLNGEVVKSGSYPSRKEFSEWFEIDASELNPKIIKKTKKCCCGDNEGCC